MSRYVDIETIKPRQYENSDADLGVLAYDYDEIDAMPFLDIVRCKECKHWDEEDHRCNIRDSYGWDYKADDFCSYGEREGE